VNDLTQLHNPPATLSGETKGQGQKRTDFSEVEKPVRLYYLDWLRVLAVLGVFYAHAVSIFDMLYWQANDSRGNALIVFGTEWGMALFFLLAGASAWFSLGSRSGRQFIRERFVRLVIPCAVGVLLLSPPQGYLLDVIRSVYPGSFFQYYLAFFLGVHFSWNPQVLAAYGFHLWFLAFLFLFSVLALAPFLALKSVAGRRVTDWLAGVCSRKGGLFLFLLPLALLQLALRPAFPDYQGWSDFFIWFMYFVYGYIVMSDARLVKAVEKQGMIALVVGVVSLGGLLVTMYGPGVLHIWEDTPGYVLSYEMYQLVWIIIGWSWMLFVLYFGMRCLNAHNPFIRYLNEAILPFYVLHFFVIVMMAFFFARWQVATAPRFLVVSTLALAATLVVYEVLIRRIPVMRRLFGMKKIA
jgi:peptidoglycan/LPS O-acetylase OafA/YrhL